MTLYFSKNGKKVFVTSNVVFRRSVFSKGFGLMFHSKIIDEAHLFYFCSPRRVALTMLFVFFPIDVVFLKNNVVVELKKNFRPFSNYISREKADLVIELPLNFIDDKKIIVGSKLVLD
ncbi:DUF192 domain-containing protein [Candidatus Woesearchaeota archaeon]|nr:DUF192 domain-containing protein [Candidatus Woesearchaeota archaeon]